MRNSERNNVVYEYRYANLSEGMRHTLKENSVSLFERSRKKLRKIKRSSARETLIAKVGVMAAIILIGIILSFVI